MGYKRRQKLMKRTQSDILNAKLVNKQRLCTNADQISENAATTNNKNDKISQQRT